MDGLTDTERHNLWEKENRKRIILVVKPDLAADIDKAAKQAGQSRTAWIVEAIKDKLNNNNQ